MHISPNRAAAKATAFRTPKESIGDLDAETAGRLMAACHDIAIVIDRDGVIRDVAVNSNEISADSVAALFERRWVDTVTAESRRKVEEMLSDASANGVARWREVNQNAPQGSVPIRYIVLNTGNDGRVIALGRDLSSLEAMQQRLLQAQQSMERDYAKLRQAEARYRVLFQIASEPVLIVDQSSRKIIEANPAAAALLGLEPEALSGRLVPTLLHADMRSDAIGLLFEASGNPIAVQLADGRNLTARTSIFRQDGTVHVLITLSGAPQPPAATDDLHRSLPRVVERIPDAFVVTNDAFVIETVNTAFLDMSQIGSSEVARGEPLSRFLGRPGVDLKVLAANLREHGWVRNFASVARTAYGDQEEVELSAVSVTEGEHVHYGLCIRPARRIPAAPATNTPRALPRTAEQLTQLVGRVSLREIVAETVDVIERMCIEAALDLTNNNRASAAELLGLSRQSLYSKLNRHGVGQADDGQSDP